MIDPNTVRTWLYQSEFVQEMSDADIDAMIDSFSNKNKRLGLTGFLITNGKTVMQLLEGDHDTVTHLKAVIMKDDRHKNIITEVWDMEPQRAYPHWSMKAISTNDYEVMFTKIENAKIETIATSIAKLTFDATFSA